MIGAVSSDYRPGSETTLKSTFVFADIAGFTALTEAHGDERRRISWPTSALRSRGAALVRRDAPQDHRRRADAAHPGPRRGRPVRTADHA